MDTTGSMRELLELLKDFDTLMLVTRAPDGTLRARPMERQDATQLADCDLWFVSAAETPKTDEIEHEHEVCVCAYNPKDRSHVSISARAWIERNHAEIHRLWRPEWSVWLPEGADDGAVALLKLTIERADYWRPEGGRARVLYQAAKAKLEGAKAPEKLPPVKHIR